MKRDLEMKQGITDDYIELRQRFKAKIEREKSEGE